MTPRSDLVLLTSAFPFGTRSEPFLEPEIEVLASRFRRIYLLPSHLEPGVRPLPDNVDLVEMPWLEVGSRARRLGTLCSRTSIHVLASTLRYPSNWRPYLLGSRMFLGILATGLLKYRMLKSFVTEQGLEKAVFYDYWFENSTLALALLRKHARIGTAVARAHRFDLFDEDWEHLRVPFREVKLSGLDRVFPVSKAGSEYLLHRAPWAAEKIIPAYLGVRGQPDTPPPRGSRPLIVSCGSLIGRKRTHLIPLALAGMGRRLKWVHLGDGPERSRIIEAASLLPPGVEWELPGHLSNTSVLQFYRENPVDVFVSASASEGLPVSFMEAMSFGVPVVSARFRGVREIVTPQTGVVVDLDGSMDRMAEGISAALEPDRFKPAEIRAFFHRRFEATTNYQAFCDALCDLQKDPAAPC